MTETVAEAVPRTPLVVMEGEPEALTLGLWELEPLTEGHCEGVCEAQCVALLLKVPLPLRVPEGEAEAVPRKPSAAAPPEALMLPVPHPRKDVEGVQDVEGDPEAEGLALGDNALAVER